MLNLKEYRSRPSQLSDYLPWAALAAPGVVLNKDGSLQRTIRYRGPDLESASAEELVSFTARVNNMMRRFGAGWALLFEAERFPAQQYIMSDWEEGVAFLIDEERRDQFERAGHYFESVHYLTFTYLPPSDNTAKTEQLFLSSDGDDDRIANVELIDQFRQETDRAIDLLSSLVPECAALTDDETLSYLHATVSTKRHMVAAPNTPAYLDAILTDTALAGGLAPKLGDEFLQVISVCGFPSATEPGLLDELNALGFSYRWATRFIPLDKTTATKQLAKYRRQWFAKRKSIAAILKETLFNEESVLVDADADNKTADADAALQELGSDDVSFGYLSTTIVVRHRDLDAAKDMAREVERVLNNRGFVTIHESVNAVDAWLGTLPGHLYANIRQPLVHSLNLAHIAPLSSVWAGQACNEHLGGPPLFMATTQGTTPFRLSTHIGDVGHTLIVGPTGAGKSVLLAFMAIQFCRYNGAQIFAFDKGRSMRAAILGLGGNFLDLGEEQSLAFQPLRSIDDDAVRSRAHAWLVGIFKQEGVAIDPGVTDAVWSALNNLASAPTSERTITGLSLLLQRADLRDALRPYTIDGAHGGLFDADAETLEICEAQCFEMETLMRREAAVAPALSYLFDRLDARFDGRPTLLMLDEAWVFLDHPLFAGRLRDWLKTLRKKNVSVIFSTQSLSDIENSTIAPAVIESCLSRIFLPNARAQEVSVRTAYSKFGLNARQIEIIAAMTPKRDYYYQSALGNRVFDLELGPLALAFCGASSLEDHKLIDQILEPGDWRRFAPEFLRAKNLQWAADLLDCNQQIQGETLCAAE